MYASLQDFHAFIQYFHVMFEGTVMLSIPILRTAGVQNREGLVRQIQWWYDYAFFSWKIFKRLENMLVGKISLYLVQGVSAKQKRSAARRPSSGRRRRRAGAGSPATSSPGRGRHDSPGSCRAARGPGEEPLGMIYWAVCIHMYIIYMYTIYICIQYISYLIHRSLDDFQLRSEKYIQCYITLCSIGCIFLYFCICRFSNRKWINLHEHEKTFFWKCLLGLRD